MSKTLPCMILLGFVIQDLKHVLLVTLGYAYTHTHCCNLHEYHYTSCNTQNYNPQSYNDFLQ